MTKSIGKKSTTGSPPPAVPLVITPTFSPWTHTSDEHLRAVARFSDSYCILFPDRVVPTVLLLLYETSCPPQQQVQGLPASVPGLETTDVRLHCCYCWCCRPVLLLLWFGHTHAHQNCTSDLWVEGIHTTSRDTSAGYAASRP